MLGEKERWKEVKNKERKVVYEYLKSRDPTVFDKMGVRNYALRLVLIHNADKLSKIRSACRLIPTVEKLKELLSRSVYAEKSTSFACRYCDKRFRNKVEALEHVIKEHGIPSL